MLRILRELLQRSQETIKIIQFWAVQHVALACFIMEMIAERAIVNQGKKTDGAS
jgi:hypothetical protein